MDARSFKRISLALAIAASFSWLAAAGTADAGVIIHQDVTMPGADGHSRTVDQTVLIQGNRSKSSSPEGATITDLDRRSLIVIDSDAKTATEMPLDSFGRMMSPALVGEFRPTNVTRKVAGYECQEFEHPLEGGSARGVSRTCVSKSAPGAAEASKFYSRSIEAMAGRDAGAHAPGGLVLSEESIVQPMPAPASADESAKRLAQTGNKVGSQKSTTRVTKIETGAIDPSEFAVPPGYKLARVDPRDVPR